MQQDGYRVFLSYEPGFVKLMEDFQKRYPSELFAIQGLANSNLDINAFSKDFFRKSAGAGNVASVSVDPNSNIGEMHVAQWTHEHPKGIMKLNSLYLIWDYVKKCFDLESANEIVEALFNGTIFVNDGHQFERPYCFGFDLMPLMMDGLQFFSRLKIKAPKRSDSFIDLLIQATAFLSNQIAGATSFPTFFVNLDWYLKKDHGESYAGRINQDLPMTYTINQYFQKLIYSWNYPFRGAQSPFVNVSVLDKGFLEALFGTNEYGAPKYVNPDGTAPDLDSIYKLQKQFYEYYNSIFGVENIFTFPVTTLACSLDEDGEFIDPDFIDWVCRTYPNKCIANIYIGKPTSFSSCCRMKNDFEKIAKDQKQYQNSFGVGGISIGSTRVAGLNFPRIAFEMKKDGSRDFEPYVKKYMDLCHKILYAHRILIQNHIEAGFLPLYTAGWIDLNKQYGTFGFIGQYEFLDILGLDITTDVGSSYGVEVLKLMEDMSDTWSSEDKISYNIEQIPGESMAVRLAKLDKLLGYNKDYEVELYSNQYVPLVKEADIYTRFKIQGKMDSLTSGGSILHLNIDDGATLTPIQVRALIDTARATGTVYFAINRVFVTCEHNHISISNNGKCPECGGKIMEQFTRVVGFIVATKSWHPTRQKEFKQRFFYSARDRFFEPNDPVDTPYDDCFEDELQAACL
jgi:ribonucleoside-triphosphate reductase (formate)